jgi:hypothetical protein
VTGACPSANAAKTTIRIVENVRMCLSPVLRDDVRKAGRAYRDTLPFDSRDFSLAPGGCPGVWISGLARAHLEPAPRELKWAVPSEREAQVEGRAQEQKSPFATTSEADRGLTDLPATIIPHSSDFRRFQP